MIMDVREGLIHVNASSPVLMSHVIYEWGMSCHIWMSRATYKWVMSHVNESCHVWMSHVMYEWVVSRTNESCHIRMSHDTYEWVIPHINESCHIWMRHVRYEWIMSSCHIWIIATWPPTSPRCCYHHVVTWRWMDQYVNGPIHDRSIQLNGPIPEWTNTRCSWMHQYLFVCRCVYVIKSPRQQQHRYFP